MSPTLRIVLLQLGVESTFGPLMALAFVAMLGIEDGRSTALGVFAAVYVVRAVCQVLMILRCVRPIEHWRALSEIKRDTPEVALDAARAAYRTPYVSVATYSIIWALSIPLMMVILVGLFSDRIALDASVTPGMIVWTAAIMSGSLVVGFPLAEWALRNEVRLLSLRLGELGLAYRGRGMSLTVRLVAFTLIWAAAPCLWLGSSSYVAAARGRAQLAAAENHAALLELAAAARAPDPATGKPPDPAALVDDRAGAFLLADDATLHGATVRSTFAEHEPVLKQVQAAAARAPSGRILDMATGIAISYTRIDPSTVLGLVASTDLGPGQGFWTMVIILLTMVALGTTMSTWFLTRSTVSPIVLLSKVVEDIRAGKVDNATPVAIYHHDETGRLAADVNGMLDVLRTLSRQAKSIGTGDLSATFSIGGDLGDSFRSQLDSLRSIVGHLAQNATQLGAAATELYAASQEQETAAGHQSAGVNEVGKTMDSLLAAAAHISEATQGVLAKAERTRETTDRTAEKIGELSAHAGRIGEILDVIREIADRSDLLALNASLEGTRAGDAGRGFTLVAAEMRKLAERVMASVGDIKQLIADVRGSIATTIMVTEESAKLADGTTESARQISLVTQQQSSGTEQAAHSMRDVASMLTQSLSATQQMRALAGNLKGQAEQLTTLVARFRVSNGTGASA